MKGKRVQLYQDLYERYSRLELSYVTDRPFAIRGLETRLLSALNTKGGYGVFDIYLRRSLLWQRKGISLERIDFLKEAREPIPSWSWMAYAGAIRYMDLPLGEVKWDQWGRDVVSPWKGVEGCGGKQPLELQVLVRDIAVVEPGARVFVDEPSRTFDLPSKCVIVGSSKGSNKVKGQMYYALIVVLLDTGEGNVFERSGVAFLREHQIVWDKPGTEAYVR